MNKKNQCWLVVLLLGCASFAAAAEPAPYASPNPLPEPAVFAPGVISTGDYETHPAFTPDGKTIYFLKNTPTFSFWTIVDSHFSGGHWSTPEVAPFSGQYSDADPFITADGSKLFFISTRPLKAGEKAKDLDIWVMEKTAKGWGEPRNLGETVNSSEDEWYPTVAADGTLYFGSGRPGGKGRTDLYRARYNNGAYQQPENLGAPINTEFQEYEPFIAPDQSFLIFMAARPRNAGDLYISYNRNGTWTEPKSLGEKINSAGTEYSPKISPDGKYFFFSSTKAVVGEQPFPRRQSYKELTEKLRSPGNGLGDIYQVDLSAVEIEHAR